MLLLLFWWLSVLVVLVPLCNRDTTYFHRKKYSSISDGRENRAATVAFLAFSLSYVNANGKKEKGTR
jgi:hypothetical protein